MIVLLVQTMKFPLRQVNVGLHYILPYFLTVMYNTYASKKDNHIVETRNLKTDP